MLPMGAIGAMGPSIMSSGAMTSGAGTAATMSNILPFLGGLGSTLGRTGATNNQVPTAQAAMAPQVPEWSFFRNGVRMPAPVATGSGIGPPPPMQAPRMFGLPGGIRSPL